MEVFFRPVEARVVVKTPRLLYLGKRDSMIVAELLLHKIWLECRYNLYYTIYDVLIELGPNLGLSMANETVTWQATRLCYMW